MLCQTLPVVAPWWGLSSGLHSLVTWHVSNNIFPLHFLKDNRTEKKMIQNLDCKFTQRFRWWQSLACLLVKRLIPHHVLFFSYIYKRWWCHICFLTFNPNIFLCVVEISSKMLWIVYMWITECSCTSQSTRGVLFWNFTRFSIPFSCLTSCVWIDVV